MNNVGFFEEAFEKLIEQGKIERTQLKQSIATEEMINLFEKKNQISVPSDVRDYLKLFSHDLYMIESAIPMDEIYNHNAKLMQLINEMNEEKLCDYIENEEIEAQKWWCGLVSVPEEDPLLALQNYLKGFREYASFDKFVSEEQVKQFLPIANWMNAGYLCIDTSKNEENVDYNNPETWKLRWFDHERFDFKKAGYINEYGEVTGKILLPDFKTFILIYFYGFFNDYIDG